MKGNLTHVFKIDLPDVLLALSVVCLVNISKAQPTADFTSSSPSLNCSGTVNYTNTTSGGALPYLSYTWTFPGGTPSSSTSPNPSVTYNTPGTYDVTLEVEDANFDMDVEYKASYVTVSSSFTMSNITGTSPVAPSAAGVAYSVTNHAGNTYAWTVTGGTIASGQGTNSITVNWGATNPGDVSVTESDGTCSYSKSMYVNICANTVSGNLAPNPGFECNSVCPTGVSNIAEATSWFRVPNHGGSPDYYNTCATSAAVDVPTNNMGTNQNPRTGNAYAGFYTYNPSLVVREYIEVQLTSPMVAATTYTISFYVLLASNCRYAVDRIGAYVSTGSISGTTPFSYPPLPFTPQVQNSSGVISNKVTWTLITGTYVAAGGENHITIGNFYANASTAITDLGSGLTSSYYFIDDVSITGGALPVELLSFTGKQEGGGNILEWQAAGEHGNDHFTIERQAGNEKREVIGKVKSAANGTGTHHYSFFDKSSFAGITYYRLMQTDLNGESRELGYVAIRNEGTNHISIQPDLFSGRIHFILQATDPGTANVVMFDMVGKTVRSSSPDLVKGENRLQEDISGLPEGTYFIRVSLGSGESRTQRVFVGRL